LFRKSLEEGIVPADWKYANISVVTVTGTATAVFICHRTSTTTEVEIGASDGVPGQCITFITRVVNS